MAQEFIRIMREDFKTYKITYFNGCEVDDLWYIEIYKRFLNNITYCQREDGMYNIIDHNGKLQFENWFEDFNYNKIGNSYLFELRPIKNGKESIMFFNKYILFDLQGKIEVIYYDSEEIYLILKDKEGVPGIFNLKTKEYVFKNEKIIKIYFDDSWFHVIESSEDEVENIFDIESQKYIFKEWFKDINFYSSIKKRKGYFIVKNRNNMFNLLSTEDTESTQEEFLSIYFKGIQNKCMEFIVRRSKDRKYNIIIAENREYKRKIWSRKM